jgi:hypothetical protein
VVVNERDTVDGIISLSDMLRFFCSNKPIVSLATPEVPSPAVDCADCSAPPVLTASRARSPVLSNAELSPEAANSASSGKKKSHKPFGKISFKQSICSSKYRQNVIEETNEETT